MSILDKVIAKRGYNETRKSVIYNVIEPRRMGRVLWAKDSSGRLLPVDLLNKLPDSDADLVAAFGLTLIMRRGVSEVLSVHANDSYEFPRLIAPYLAASMDHRSEAKIWMADGRWAKFWELFAEEPLEETRAPRM